MVKGAALFLQQGNSPQGQRSLQHPHKHAGEDGTNHFCATEGNHFCATVGGKSFLGLGPEKQCMDISA